MSVYFIQAGDTGPVKIGFTDNVSGRLNKMKADCPAPLIIIGVAVGDRTVERSFHEKFAQYRLAGEWFAPDPALIAFIKTLPAIPEVIKSKRRRPSGYPIVDEVIIKAGGVNEIAKVFGIAAPSVSGWRRIPAERVLRLEEMTGISRYAMRPDIFGEAA